MVEGSLGCSGDYQSDRAKFKSLMQVLLFSSYLDEDLFFSMVADNISVAYTFCIRYFIVQIV